MKPKPVPKGSALKTIAGAKNWIILGVALAAGYVVYKKFIAPMAAEAAAAKPPAASKKAPKVAKPGTAPAPDLAGPKVKKGVLASSRSPICIGTKASGFSYAPVTSTDASGYNEFTSNSNGRFTRRFLCIGTQKYAEIKPS